MAFDHPQQHAGYAGGQPQVGIDLRQLLAGVWRRRMMILGTVAIALATTMTAMTLMAPRYSSEALVMVEDGEPSVLRSPAEQPSAPPDALSVQSEVEVLRSRDLAQAVANKLELGKLPEFNPSAPGGSFFSEILTLVGLGTSPESLGARDKLFDAYFSKLSVYAVPNSRVISIGFTSHDPKLSASVANTVADTYIDQTSEAKFASTRRAAEWLAKEVEALRGRVSDAESAVEQFRARSGLFRGTETTLDRQELSELNSQLTVAASARAEAQSRADAIRDTLEREGSVERAPEVLNSRLIQRLREQQATLRRQIADLGQTYLPNHPRMKSLKAEMDGLGRQIRSEATKIAAGLEDEARTAGAREKALRAKLDKLKTQAALTNQDEVRLAALEREAAANRTLLESFLTKYREATARTDASALPPGARVISRAQPRGTPSFPRPVPMLLLALIGSLIVGMVFAFIGEMFSAPSVAMPAAAPIPPPVTASAPISAAPVLRQSIVPAMAPSPAPVVPPPSASPCPRPPRVLPPLDGRSGDRLRGRVRELAARLSTRRMLTTSVGANGGRSTVVLGLARSLATGRARTLVIDADFTAPDALARTFGMAGDRGLSEVLLGTCSFGEVVKKDETSGADVVVAGASGESAARLLESDRMDLILGALEQAYDIVVVNGPPATGQDFGKMVARRTPLALIVADDDQNGVDAALLASHVLIAEGVREVLPIHVDGSGSTSEIKFGESASGYGHAA